MDIGIALSYSFIFVQFKANLKQSREPNIYKKTG